VGCIFSCWRRSICRSIVSDQTSFLQKGEKDFTADIFRATVVLLAAEQGSEILANHEEIYGFNGRFCCAFPSSASFPFRNRGTALNHYGNSDRMLRIPSLSFQGLDVGIMSSASLTVLLLKNFKIAYPFYFAIKNLGTSKNPGRGWWPVARCR